MVIVEYSPPTQFKLIIGTEVTVYVVAPNLEAACHSILTGTVSKSVTIVCIHFLCIIHCNSMLRSSNNAHLLQSPRVHTSVASHAFTITTSTMWNSLSANTWSADSFASLKRRPKFKLFASTYATKNGSALSQCSDSCFTWPIVLYKSGSIV